MQHYAAFHQGLHYLLRLKQPSWTEIPHNLGTSTRDPLKYKMGNHMLIASICMGKSIRIHNMYSYLNFSMSFHLCFYFVTGPRSAVGNVSGNRCESDCRSRGREFDPGPVPYFRGDWSWNNFYGHSPPFRWIIQEGLSVTSESMCTKYWLTACSSLPRKKCG